MKKSILLVIIITFVGSYGTFKVIKLNSRSAIMQEIKYYNLLIPNEKEINPYASDDDAFVQSLMIGYTNSFIHEMRPKVIYGTLIAFVLSLIPAIFIIKKDKSKRNSPNY